MAEDNFRRELTEADLEQIRAHLGIEDLRGLMGSLTGVVASLQDAIGSLRGIPSPPVQGIGKPHSEEPFER